MAYEWHVENTGFRGGLPVPISEDRMIYSPMRFGLEWAELYPGKDSIGERELKDAQVTYQVLDGQFVCTRLVLTAIGDMARIRKADLRRLDLEAIGERAIKRWSRPIKDTDESGVTIRVDGVSDESDARAAARAAQRAVRRQRGYPPELLDRVARVHAANPEAPVKAVAEAERVSRRTASTYVRLAKERGHIPTEENDE